MRHAIAALPTVFSLIGGVYNFGSENPLSMYETALDFAKALGIRLDINRTGFKRSLAIDCSKLRQHGIVLDNTQDGLRRCMRDYGLNP